MLENRPITGLIIIGAIGLSNPARNSESRKWKADYAKNKSSKMDSESLQLWESINWPTDSVSKICLVLKEKLEEEYSICWRKVPSKDANDNDDMWTRQKRQKIEDKENRVMIWLAGTRLPPRVIARKLKVSRDTKCKAARKINKKPETSFSAGKLSRVNY